MSMDLGRHLRAGHRARHDHDGRDGPHGGGHGGGDDCGCGAGPDHGGRHADGRYGEARAAAAGEPAFAAASGAVGDRALDDASAAGRYGDADAFLQLSYASVGGEGPNSLRSLIEAGVLDTTLTETGYPNGDGPNGDGPVLASLSAPDGAARPAPSWAAHDPGRVFDVYVEPGLLCEIEQALRVYAADLACEGYDVKIRPFSGTAEELRAELQARWSNAGLEGALLVGDLPYLDFTSEENFGGPATGNDTYPHDLYFMDLDGTYTLSATGLDAHTGDVGPEIYVSRLAAGDLGGILAGGEADLINAYFDKVHDVRTGALGYEDRGIWFADDDWAGTDPLAGFGGLYDAAAVEGVTSTADTTLARYAAELGENAETLVEMLHSWPQGHQVGGAGGGFLTSADVVAANPQAGFVNMFNCSGADFTAADNLIGAYLFGSDHVVNAVGSTKTGSMLNFQDFYAPQAGGDSIGLAFLRWFDANAAATDDPASDWQVDWFYGMAMQGDPTLQPSAIA